ncbi:TPA: hypothetical protein EYN98_09175 [Candidatus Poribacteria bacterium]|nr:hypothetical protein [Candidatus Poribacteria bacterium]
MWNSFLMIKMTVPGHFIFGIKHLMVPSHHPLVMSRLTDAQLQSPPTLNASTDGKPRSLRTGKPMGHNHHWYPDGKFIGDKTWEIFMRDYVRTVRGVDDAIGRLLDKLDKMRISENTLVIHTSDHGYFHGEFGLADKRWMYDPSIRVPYLIRYPKLIRRS